MWLKLFPLTLLIMNQNDTIRMRFNRIKIGKDTKINKKPH